MAKRFADRLAELERLEAATRTRKPWQRRYYLPYDAYPQAIIQAFRAGDLCVAGGRIAIDTNPTRYGWPCDWIADALNAFDGWGDVFLNADEIAAARELVDLGWIAYQIRRPPDPGRTGWDVLLSHAQTHELYMTDRPRYFAIHEMGRHIAAAAPVAAWRLGVPIETVALRAWLDTARPLTLSPAMVEAIEPIIVGGLAATGLGLDPKMLLEIDYDEEF